MIDRNTILQRLPELELKLYSNNALKIKLAGGSYTVDYFGLRILDVFSTPRSMGEALEMLSAQTRGAQDWVDLTRMIIAMVQSGILIEVGAHQSLVLKPVTHGFDAASIHIHMLNDRNRTSAYLEAIHKVVQPGDVVLDLGTGTGVLAVAAAQAGAKRVYAIEATSIGKYAERVFDANGFAGCISLVTGWSTQVSLPEDVDVIVSEIIGNDPFGERVLEATIDARKRFTKPSAHWIPLGMQVYAVPVVIPEKTIGEYIFHQPDLAEWREWYGIDFSPLGEIKLDAPLFFGRNPYDTRSWQKIAPAQILLEVDFQAIESLMMHGKAEFTAQVDGHLDGALIYFDLDLGNHIRLSVSPENAGPESSWRTLVWLLAEPLKLKYGEKFLLEYTYHGSGVPDGVRASRL